MERRYCEFVRADLMSDRKSFRGIIAPFYNAKDPSTVYQLDEDLYERIMPTAFERSLKSGEDIILTYDHQDSTCMGRTGLESLRLWTDETGLRFECPYNADDPDHKKARAKILGRAVYGCSFSFTIPKKGEKIVKERGKTYSELHDVNLMECAIVVRPAYGTGTDAQFRNVGQLTDDRLALYHQFQKTLEQKAKWESLQPRA